MPRTSDSPQLALRVSEDRDHILGPREAPVTMVEYADFECPHCGRAHFILQELMAQISDPVRLVCRHFPLTQIHPHAQRAAEASEVAGAQGQFWEMHDTLFENQNALEDEDLLAYAEGLGLDVERFQNELLQGAHVPRIRNDFMSGVRSGVNGTPTFFINGYRHDGALDLESLMEAVAQGASRRPTSHIRTHRH